MKRPLLRRLALAALFFAIGAVCAEPPLTVAVLNFAQADEGAAHAAHAWMRKGLADLLINDLASSPALRILTREHMQMLLQEAGLQRNLLREMPPEESEKLKRYFAVDRVLFGLFAIEDGALTLQATLINQHDGQVVARFREQAPLADVLKAEKALARKLLGFFTGQNASEASWPLPQWTDSTSATQRLYEGVDLFDGGDYLRAWYAFRQAARIDPDFADAHYWAARMHYYRTDYAHARLDYERFIRRFPRHARVGDAVMELIHSAERLSDSPQEVLSLYQTFQGREWQGVQVHNQADHLSRSPLSDWLAKREQGALAFLGRYEEAYQALLRDLSVNATSSGTGHGDWRGQASELLGSLAARSEDSGGPRLMSGAAPYTDVHLTLEKPWVEEDLRALGMKGHAYTTSKNQRILAPPGYRFKSLKAEIMRTNDPKLKSVCRLSIRRYRYVDINSCWTDDKDQAVGKRYVFDIALPPTCTWFLLRPEYDGMNGNPNSTEGHQGSFDGWRVDAEFEPLAAQAGGIDLRVNNVMAFNAAVDGRYARCQNGVIGNLAPGMHTLRISDMYNRKIWGYEPLETTFDVRPGTYDRLSLDLALNAKSRQAGWDDPVGVACDYPTYKHSPRRTQNWRDGAPSFAADRVTGLRVVVWAHLDDLWLATSTNGVAWSKPVNLPAPVNSAHVELNPRLIVTEAGRYALLFLSDRGLQRSLGTYVCSSDDLTHWTHPVLVSAAHHLDQCLIQERSGRYLLVAVPAVNDPPYFEWRASADLDVWSEPQRIAVAARPQCMSLAQDANSTYHLIWLASVHIQNMGSSNDERVHHMTSRDLIHWSTPALVPFDSGYILNASAAVVDDHLWVAVGTYDPSYSGQMQAALFSRDLSRYNSEWRQADLPEHALSGLTSAACDPLSKRLVLSWAMTDMQMNAERFSGPIFVMSGLPQQANPVPLRLHPAVDWWHRFDTQPAPATIPRMDARTALVLDTPSMDTTFQPQPVFTAAEYTRRAAELLKGLPKIAQLEKDKLPLVGARIMCVQANSQARQLGLQIGDWLTAIDGVPIAADGRLVRSAGSDQTLDYVTAAGELRQAAIRPGLVGICITATRREDAWYFRQPQRQKRFDRDMQIALASVSRDANLAEHAWSRLLEAGYEDPEVSRPALATLALRRGFSVAADALLRDWRPSPEADAVLVSATLRRQIDCANGAYATPDHALSPVPDWLRTLNWGAVAAAPPPSSLLDELSAQNLMAGMQNADPPFAVPDDILTALRARHSFSPRLRRNQQCRLGFVPDHAPAHVAWRVCFRVNSIYGCHGAFLITDEAAEAAWEKLERKRRVPERQLAFDFSVHDDKTTFVELVANGYTLVSYEVPGFADRDHTLIMIQYADRGEIFLDNQRVALVPLAPRTGRPLFLMRLNELSLFFIDELDVWELKAN